MAEPAHIPEMVRSAALTRLEQYDVTSVALGEEFLMQEGQAPMPIPEFYLIRGNGDLKKLTRNEWYGLARVYEDRPVKIDRPLVGTPGNQLWSKIYLEAAVKRNAFGVLHIHDLGATLRGYKEAFSNLSFVAFLLVFSGY